MSDAFDRHWKNGLELYEAGKLVDAVVEWRLGKKQEAVDFLKSATAVDPTDPTLYLALLECQQ